MSQLLTGSRVRLGVALTVLVTVACGDGTGPEDAKHPSEIRVAQAGLRTTVNDLAHDSLCGRATGTLYERRTAEYVANAFARSGLEPKGTSGYFQPVLTGPSKRALSSGAGICEPGATLGSQNVIGAVSGTGALAGQWVVVGAHYDHVGWEVEDGLTRIFNGADDNASGTAVVLEVARLLAAWIAAHPETVRDRRSIMFHAYGAEEVGLYGSRQFATTPTVPGDSLYAMVNLDMVGRLRGGTLLVIGSVTSDAWPGLFEGVRPDDLQYAFSSESMDRSDAWSFILLRGTPAVHVFTGLHQEYHTPADDPALLDFDGMARIAEITLGVLWELATRPGPM